MKKIGIDLGTTNCAVSVYEMGTTRMVQLEGSTTAPSVIWITNSKGEMEFIVGKEAKKHIATDPDHILSSTKRDLGSDKKYNIAGATFTPTDAATLLLGYLKKETEKYIGETFSDVVITIPAYFGFQEVGEVKKAAQNAGLNPVAIIPEPTAAAIRYGIEMSSARQNICIVDLGGGTFDVTVLEVKFDKKTGKHIVKPVYWDGDHYLGGDDFDNAIIEWMIQNGAKGFKNKLELKSLAEAAKIELAQLPETEISHPNYFSTPVVLNLKCYKNLIQDKLEQIGTKIKETVENAVVDGKKLGMENINRFVLVGGSCKHRVVVDYIKTIIGKDSYYALNLDNFVAEGAALYHNALNAPTSSLLVDDVIKLPKTLGVNVVKNNREINAKILHKGDCLPARSVNIFQTQYPQQEHVIAKVIEGDAEEAEGPGNRELDQLEIKLSDPNIHPVVVEYCVDATGYLTFICHEVILNKNTETDITDLGRLAKGDANSVPLGDWDNFKTKHAEAIKSKKLQMSIMGE